MDLPRAICTEYGDGRARPVFSLRYAAFTFALVCTCRQMHGAVNFNCGSRCLPLLVLLHTYNITSLPRPLLALSRVCGQYSTIVRGVVLALASAGGDGPSARKAIRSGRSADGEKLPDSRSRRGAAGPFLGVGRLVLYYSTILECFYEGEANLRPRFFLSSVSPLTEKGFSIFSKVSS